MTALSSDERKALFVVHKGVFGPSLSHALNGYLSTIGAPLRQQRML